MRVISKNGVKLDIQPKRWWNLRDWFWVLEQADIIRNQDIYMNTEDWKFSSGSIVREVSDGK